MSTDRGIQTLNHVVKSHIVYCEDLTEVEMRGNKLQSPPRGHRSQAFIKQIERK